MLTQIFRDRGVRLDRTMQLNVGGNSDFLNMLERDRLESKKISKTNAVTSVLDYDLGAENVHVGPSDYVPWLTDRKWAYIRMEGTTFGNVLLNLELKLEVWDSPNSAGIVIDAVRLAKLALNKGISGALEAPSAYLMKSPPKQIPDAEARDAVERFIAERPKEGSREDHRLARTRLGGTVALRICLVTPFSWSQPHDVNEHVAGAADALRKVGHDVSVLARRIAPPTCSQGGVPCRTVRDET